MLCVCVVCVCCVCVLCVCVVCVYVCVCARRWSWNRIIPFNAHLPTAGAHPMSKLVVMDSRLPVTATIYAYSRYKVGDMNTSATPAVAFTAVLENPLNENVTASFMFNFPHGIEPHTQRTVPQMSPNGTLYKNSPPLRSIVAMDTLSCFEFCNSVSICSSWSYDEVGGTCLIYEDVRMNGYKDGNSAGVKVRGVAVDLRFGSCS